MCKSVYGTVPVNFFAIFGTIENSVVSLLHKSKIFDRGKDKQSGVGGLNSHRPPGCLFFFLLSWRLCCRLASLNGSDFMHFEGFGHTQTKRQAAKKDFPHVLEMTKKEGA